MLDSWLWHWHWACCNALIQHILLYIDKRYLENKNRLPTRTPASSSILMTDRDLLQRKPYLHACVHAFMPACNICMFACLGATGWSSWVVWLMTVAAQSPRAAPCCSFPLCCVPISPFLLQKGRPFPAHKSPNSPHIPCQASTDLRHPGQA